MGCIKTIFTPRPSGTVRSIYIRKIQIQSVPDGYDGNFIIYNRKANFNVLSSYLLVHGWQ